MPSLSVETRPYGFELETPSPWYWFKAGIAFTFGAGLVTLVGYAVFWFLWIGLVMGGLRALLH